MLHLQQKDATLTSNHVSHMIRCMAGEMDSFASQISNVKHLVVLKECFKDSLILPRGNSVPLTEKRLHMNDAFPYADPRLAFLLLGEPTLEIGSGGQMIGMGVSF